MSQQTAPPERTGERDKKPLGDWAYVIGGLSFIPLIGVLFGFVSICAGAFAWRDNGWRVALMGICGIGSTVLLYSMLFYLGVVQRGGMYDVTREQLARMQVTQLVKTIEFYRVQNGVYPTVLEALKGSGEPGFASTYDTSRVQWDLNWGDSFGRGEEFFYRRLDGGEGYYLLGVGLDGIPFTRDDLLPQVDVIGGVGLKIHPDSKNSGGG